MKLFIGILTAAIGLVAGQAHLIEIGTIDYFGYGRRDITEVRNALPVHVGDSIQTDHSDPFAPVYSSVTKTWGRAPSDISTVCCDSGGKWILYVGLGTRPQYEKRFRGSDLLPHEVLDLYGRFTSALMDAVRAGETDEDDSQGYALAKNNALKAIQLDFREYALSHDERLRKVLDNASDPEQRRIAALVLGYAAPTKAQINALADAAFDPDEIVRNNAIRSLAVRVRVDAKAARWLTTSRFLPLLEAGTWTDRNKGLLLWEALTSRREKDRLKDLRKVIPSLIECARWKSNGHALPARMLLGRIADLPDEQIVQLSNEGKVEQLITAALVSAGRI